MIVGLGNERNSNLSEHGLGNERYMNRQCNEYLGPRVNSVRRKEREPDKFDDKRWEWDDYLAHFMSLARWNNWSEADMASQLAMSLRGSAQTVLGNMTELEARDFGYLKAALARRYSPSERESAYRHDFRNRKWKKDENLVEYGCALRRLATKAYPKLSNADIELLVLDQFIFGMGSRTELQKHIQFGHPKTLDEAIDLAVECEAFEGVSFVRKPSVVTAGVKLEDASSDSKLQSQIAELVSTSKANAEAIEMLSQTLSGLNMLKVKPGVARSSNKNSDTIQAQGEIRP